MDKVHQTPTQEEPGKDNLKSRDPAEGINQANRIQHGWHDIALELLKKYRDSMKNFSTEKSFFADDFEFESYPAIHKNLNLPDDLQMIDDRECVTIAINYKNRPRSVLRLYLCSIGAHQIPEKIYAALHYQFGRQIAYMSEDADADNETAALRFREWFSKHMDLIFKDWLQD